LFIFTACEQFLHILKNNEKAKLCKPICSPTLICTITPDFLDSTDWRWIHAKYKITTQKKYKREPRAQKIDRYLSIDAIFDPPYFSLEITFK
jgi:hypothetical protein